MKCPKCGSALDTGFNCTKCGYRWQDGVKQPEQLKNSVVVKQFAGKVNEVIESCERQDGYDAEGSPIYTIDTAILRVEMEQIAEQLGKEE